MKKLMIGLLAASFASNAFAIASFDYGSVWFFPRYSSDNSQTATNLNLNGQGQTFTAAWDMAEDFALGAYMETTDINDGYGNTYVWSGQALVITKGVVKNASVGLRFGKFYENWNYWPTNGFTGVFTDVVGNLTLMSGTADKVSGALKATFGARFGRDYEYANNWGIARDQGGYILGLSVGIGI